METKEFIKYAEDVVYKEVAKSTNTIMGKNKTASLSTGLFLKLPIEISTEKVDNPIEVTPTKLEDFMQYFSAYTKMGDTTKVYFTFMYHSDKDLKAILRHLDKHGMFLGFVYIHEVQHIIRKHITHSYNTMMLRIADNALNAHQLINIAEDHAINYSIKDLFISSRLGKEWAKIEPIGQYSKDYHSKQLSDIEILKDIMNNTIKITPISCLFDSVEMNGKSSIQPNDPGNSSPKDNEEESGEEDKTNTIQDDLDNSISDLAEALKDVIRTNLKGSQAGKLFERVFEAVKVETGWFKKIKDSFKRQVFYKTHDFTTSWANLNNTYRKIYKSPKKQFIDDKISMILSVDHSGSMSTEDLQKLLYLVESEATKISSLTVLIHDTRVIKAFDIEDEYDISQSSEFNQALATRYTSGGTSHACVFDYIQNMKIDDTNKFIYLSFSDNHSDIENTFKDYPVMRRITNYWVCTENNPVHVPGTNIQMV